MTTLEDDIRSILKKINEIDLIWQRNGLNHDEIVELDKQRSEIEYIANSMLMKITSAKTKKEIFAEKYNGITVMRDGVNVPITSLKNPELLKICKENGLPITNRTGRTQGHYKNKEELINEIIKKKKSVDIPPLPLLSQISIC